MSANVTSQEAEGNIRSRFFFFQVLHHLQLVGFSGSSNCHLMLPLCLSVFNVKLNWDGPQWKMHWIWRIDGLQTPLEDEELLLQEVCFWFNFFLSAECLSMWTLSLSNNTYTLEIAEILQLYFHFQQNLFGDLYPNFTEILLQTSSTHFAFNISHAICFFAGSMWI